MASDRIALAAKVAGRLWRTYQTGYTTTMLLARPASWTAAELRQLMKKEIHRIIGVMLAGFVGLFLIDWWLRNARAALQRV